MSSVLAGPLGLVLVTDRKGASVPMTWTPQIPPPRPNSFPETPPVLEGPLEGNLHDWKEHLFEQQGGQCAGMEWHSDTAPHVVLCPVKVERRMMKVFEVDHIFPSDCGGPDHLENFQLLCSSCNRSKGPRTMWQWYQGMINNPADRLSSSVSKPGSVCEGRSSPPVRRPSDTVIWSVRITGELEPAFLILDPGEMPPGGLFEDASKIGFEFIPENLGFPPKGMALRYDAAQRVPFSDSYHFGWILPNAQNLSWRNKELSRADGLQVLSNLRKTVSIL